MDLYGNFAVYCIHWCKSFVSTLSCLLCHFGTKFLERSAERALNLCLDRFDRPRHARVVSIYIAYKFQFMIAPIVRIELELPNVSRKLLP